MSSFHNAIVSMPGRERVARHPHGGRIVIHATAEETGGALGMWDTFSAPGTGPTRHVHTRETEVFRVIAGTYRFWCGEEVFDAPPGTTVTLPPHVPHHWRNVSDVPGQMMAVVTPGGFERFFLDIERTGARTAQEMEALQAALGVFEVRDGG